MKSKFFTQVLCALLLTSMILGIFVSCGGTEENAVTEEATTEAEETERLWLDSLPDKKFDGKEFKTYGDAGEWRDPGDLKNARADVVSAANYDRFHTIEERFDMKFKHISATVAEDDIQKSAIGLRTYVDSEDYSFDIIHGIVCYLAPCALEGYVVDLANTEEFESIIDLSRPYWSDEYTTALSVGNHKFWLYGANDAGMYSAVFGIFFNKDIVDIFMEEDADGNKQSIYDYVYNGTWTLDTMFELQKLAYLDDGNGEKDLNDRYGFALVSGNYIDKLALGAGASFTKRDEDNIPYGDINTEQNININEKLYDIATHESYYDKDGHDMNALNFGSGQLMMFMDTIGSAQSYRNIQWEFGILPLPKYNEAQADYYGACRYSALISGIPVTTPMENYDFVYTILEANAAEVWRVTRPAFLDDGLKNKYSRDEDTKNMVDLTQKQIRTDFLICYTGEGGTSGYEYFYFDNISNNIRDISSTIARKTKPLNKQIDNIIAAMDDQTQNG